VVTGVTANVCLAIGGNHLSTCLRARRFEDPAVQHKSYGLTKGQYSPTSEFRSGYHRRAEVGVFPFIAITVALGTHAPFVARTIDVRAEASGEISSARMRIAGVIPGDPAELRISSMTARSNDDQRQGSESGPSADARALKPLVFVNNRDMGIRCMVCVRGVRLARRDRTYCSLAPTRPIFRSVHMLDFDRRCPTPVGVFYAVARHLGRAR